MPTVKDDQMAMEIWSQLSGSYAVEFLIELFEGPRWSDPGYPEFLSAVTSKWGYSSEEVMKDMIPASWLAKNPAYPESQPA